MCASCLVPPAVCSLPLCCVLTASYAVCSLCACQILIDQAKNIAVGWRNGNYQEEAEVVDLDFDLVSSIKELDSKALSTMLSAGQRALDDTQKCKGQILKRIGEVVNQSSIWSHNESIKTGKKTTDVFIDIVKSVHGFGPSRAYGEHDACACACVPACLCACARVLVCETDTLHACRVCCCLPAVRAFYLLCSVHPAFAFVKPTRDVVLCSGKTVKALNLLVPELREELRTPAPAVTMRKMDQIVVETRLAEDYQMLEGIDVANCDNIDPDEFDGCCDGEAFVEKKKQDIDHEHIVVEADEENTQVVDFEEDGEGDLSQTHPKQNLGMSQEEFHESQRDASQQDTEKTSADFGNSASSSQLLKLFDNLEVHEPTLEVQVVCGEHDVIECECETTVKGNNFGNLFHSIDLGRLKDAGLTAADFVVKEHALVADPQVDKDKEVVKIANDKHEKVDGHSHQMRSALTKMADHRNPVIHTAESTAITKMTQFKSKEQAGSATGGATK